MSPLSNAFLRKDQLHNVEPFYPLHAYVCEKCFLVQLPEHESPENIFSDYVYFSSYSDSWLRHAQDYVNMAVGRFSLADNNLVIELASNDGYLLQYFQQRGIPVLGIEPAANVARVAQEKGIPTRADFFCSNLAKALIEEGKLADLIVANNVLAHVPDLNDFIAGLKRLLNGHGTITIEVPHLLSLMQDNQFDTIYHEHYSYFSLLSLEAAFSRHDLSIFDVDELDTHGGSLRLYICHKAESDRPVTASLEALRDKEIVARMNTLDAYTEFSEKVNESKRAILQFLIEVKRQGQAVAAYGAPAKGNTLLNYCGIRQDFIDYAVDLNPGKQGRFLPGTHIPVFAPDKIRQTKPDYLFILPWNIRDEVMEQTEYIREWNGKHVIPIPMLEIVS